MKRDFELIKKILIEAENYEPNSSFSVVVEGYELSIVGAHVELLIEAKLLLGEVMWLVSGAHVQTIERLTWEGHDFLEAAKKDTLWKKAFSITKENGIAMTFEVLKSLLSKLALESVFKA